MGGGGRMRSSCVKEGCRCSYHYALKNKIHFCVNCVCRDVVCSNAFTALSHINL
jgi:hypothetical protein